MRDCKTLQQNLTYPGQSDAVRPDRILSDKTPISTPVTVVSCSSVCDAVEYRSAPYLRR